MMLVFAHLLAASMALGAIVATDLRLLAKLAQDRVRIAPPNEFVARIVLIALVTLYVTGAGIIVMGMQTRADFMQNPKLLAKIVLVLALTLNAFVLHRFTFPRLARGRRVAAWDVTDWLVVALPVGISNFLWLFVAFLGIARPWNYSVPMHEIFEIAARIYAAAQFGVFLVLAAAARSAEPSRWSPLYLLKRSLGHLGTLAVNTSPPPRKTVRVRAGRRRLPENDGASTYC